MSYQNATPPPPAPLPMVLRIVYACTPLIQNIAAIGGVVTFVLHGDISGEVGLGAIGVVLGLITYPMAAKMKADNAAGAVGAVGIFSLGAQLFRGSHYLIPFAGVLAASLLGGCAPYGVVRDDLNAMQVAAAREGAALQVLCPAALPPADPLYAECREAKGGFNDVAALHRHIQDEIDRAGL